MHHTIFQKLKYYNEFMEDQLREKENDDGDSFVTYFQRTFAECLSERLNHRLDWDSALIIATSVQVSCSEMLYNETERDEVRNLAKHFVNIVIMMNNDLIDGSIVDTRILKNLASSLSISLD